MQSRCAGDRSTANNNTARLHAERSVHEHEAGSFIHRVVCLGATVYIGNGTSNADGQDHLHGHTLQQVQRNQIHGNKHKRETNKRGGRTRVWAHNPCRYTPMASPYVVVGSPLSPNMGLGLLALWRPKASGRWEPRPRLTLRTLKAAVLPEAAVRPRISAADDLK